jgi:Fe-Mn family superoxide dismutase
MNNLSRRRFLAASSGAVAGTFVASGFADDSANLSPTDTGLITGKPKPLRFESIPGFLSAEQVTPHHSAHYGGALRGYMATDKQLQSSIMTGVAIDPHSYGAIQRARTSKGNSVILHELYFEGMTAKSNVPNAEVLAAIQKRFGSLEKWADDFQASAQAASGWAMLVFHPISGKLYNIVSDEHASGILWMGTPLVVIDVYEHAFYVDYQNRKGDYIEMFMKHIDWKEVNRRLTEAS